MANIDKVQEQIARRFSKHSAGTDVRQAEIVSVDSASTCTIDLGMGNIPGVKWLGSYQPSAGDIVWLLDHGNMFIILGKLTDPAQISFKESSTPITSFPMGYSWFNKFGNDPTGDYPGNFGFIETWRTTNSARNWQRFSNINTHPFAQWTRRWDQSADDWAAWFLSTGHWPWQTITLLNNWSAHATWREPRYRLEAGNIVRIEAMLVPWSGDINAHVFTLPVGYRPPMHTTLAPAQTSTAADQYRVSMQTNGEFRIFMPSSPSYSWVGGIWTFAIDYD